jgi:hypothetical protein
LAQIISWLDAHPDIRDRNAHRQPKEPEAFVNVRLRGDWGD